LAILHAVKWFSLFGTALVEFHQVASTHDAGSMQQNFSDVWMSASQISAPNCNECPLHKVETSSLQR
jgi:hypothetical protein